MEIRPYRHTDRDACLSLFNSNVGEFFHEVERQGLESLLNAPPPGYVVAEHDGKVVGCGGHVDARIVWLIVHRDLQGQGLGRYLMLYLLREAGRLGASAITLGTIPKVTGFYEKLGFRIVSIEPDGYAPGFDRVEMVKKMDVCA